MDEATRVADLMAKTDECEDVGNWRDITALWGHQRAACETLQRYLDRSPDNRRYAALVRMPTATGKTGVMAVACNYLRPRTNVLCIAPGKYLTFQLRDALVSNFWVRVGARPAAGIKPARTFRPSDLQALLNDLSSSSILVCTASTLQILYEEWNNRGLGRQNANVAYAAAFDELLTRVHLLIVDEGHREPARQWAKAVRVFERPTILFSATPYRNDLRMFKVGRDGEGRAPCYRYTFRYHEAVGRNVIREVEFCAASRPFNSATSDEISSRAAVFADQLLDFRRAAVAANVPADVQDPKVIVRCGTSDEMVAVFKALGRRVDWLEIVAVHDRFSSIRDSWGIPSAGRSRLLVDVPKDLANEKATYWIHQYKLTEGIDDHNICAVAFFEPFGNARALVQQIGRLLRNRSNGPTRAFVLHDPGDDLPDQFAGYRRFEECERGIVGPEEIVYGLMEQLPEWFYFDRRFRPGARDFQGMTSDEIAYVFESLRLPRSARIYRAPPGFDRSKLEQLAEEASEQLEDRDMVEIGRWIDPADRDCAVLLHWQVTQTPHFSDRAFFDIQFRPSVILWIQGLIFASGPIRLDAQDLDAPLEAISPERLERILSSNARLTQVALTNVDLGKHSVRRRAVGAFSLGSIAPSLSDHFHFVNTVIGSDAGSGGERYYLGFSRGRVTHQSRQTVGLDEFKAWATSIADQVLSDNGDDDHPVLARYARPSLPTADEEARHILIEMKELWNEYHPRVVDDLPVFTDAFDALAGDVTPRDGAQDGAQSFTCTVVDGTDGEKRIQGTIRFQNKRFRIESQDLREFLERSSSDGLAVGPDAFINTRGSFRVVTASGKLYVDRKFYEPRIPMWRLGRLEYLSHFHAVADLGTVTKSEKGKRSDGFSTRPGLGGRTWPAGSLFYLIDARLQLLSQAAGVAVPPVLVCDDMGTEFADFIGIDPGGSGRVILIHAKVYKDSFSAGASPFSEVQAQAVKNLEYLSPIATVAASRIARWSSSWKYKDTDPSGIPRIRRQIDGCGTAAQISNEIDRLARSVESDKEVWIVLGNGLEISSLRQALASGVRPNDYHLIQLLYLIQSTNHSVSQVGAKLRIFSVDMRPAA